MVSRLCQIVLGLYTLGTQKKKPWKRTTAIFRKLEKNGRERKQIPARLARCGCRGEVNHVVMWIL